MPKTSADDAQKFNSVILFVIVKNLPPTAVET